MTDRDMNVHIVVEEWGPLRGLRYRLIEAFTDHKAARDSADKFNREHEEGDRVRDVWSNVPLVWGGERMTNKPSWDDAPKWAMWLLYEQDDDMWFWLQSHPSQQATPEGIRFLVMGEQRGLCIEPRPTADDGVVTGKIEREIEVERRWVELNGCLVLYSFVSGEKVSWLDPQAGKYKMTLTPVKPEPEPDPAPLLCPVCGDEIALLEARSSMSFGIEHHASINCVLEGGEIRARGREDAEARLREAQS